MIYIFLKNKILEFLKCYNDVFHKYYGYAMNLENIINNNSNNNSNKNSDNNSNSNDEIEKFQKIQKNGLELFIKKNKDYGKAYEKYGTIGVLVRINDKISRLQTITKNEICLVNDESLKDTLIDLHNYSAIALMELNKE